jgi:hypothetical protein
MFVPLLQKTPKKSLVHCTKPKFPPEKALVHCTKPKFSPEKALVHCIKPKIFSRKNAFFATRKDMESYSQMPGKRILLLALDQIFLAELHTFSAC